MRLILLFLSAIILQFGFTACKKYVPASETFFLIPGPVSVSTGSAQGSSSHKITDLWIYNNGKFQGIYPIGSRVPIISKGQPVSLDIFAGIENNGISSTRLSWVFYQSLKLDTFAEAGATLQRPFTFKYKTETHFAWKEDFEGQGLSIVKSGTSDTGFVVDNAGGLENKFLHIAGSKHAPICMLESSGDGFDMPSGTSNIYLEMNYKCSSEILIGLITQSGQEKEAFYLNPSKDWNKIYIQLASAVGQSPTSIKHKVFIRMVSRAGNENPQLWLDNIKLLYFK